MNMKEWVRAYIEAPKKRQCQSYHSREYRLSTGQEMSWCEMEIYRLTVWKRLQRDTQ